MGGGSSSTSSKSSGLTSGIQGTSLQTAGGIGMMQSNN